MLVLDAPDSLFVFQQLLFDVYGHQNIKHSFHIIPVEGDATL
jgi:hypothetical protein